MRQVKKYRMQNLTTGNEAIYSKADFIKQYPKMFRFMDENCISKLERNEDENKTRFLYEEITQDLPGCQNCGAVAIVEVCGKTSDMCSMKHLHRQYDGYVLRDMGVGEGDYLEFDFCTNCGQIQGMFPKQIHGAIITRETEGYSYA